MGRGGTRKKLHNVRFYRTDGRLTGGFALIIGIGMVVVFIISVMLGAAHIHPLDIGKIILNRTAGCNIFPPVWDKNTETIIWNIRLPRVIMAWLVGAGLSVSGVFMQALLKNPLADPYVLGISSGASAGAVSAIVLGLFSFAGIYATSVGAVTGAWLAVLLTMGLSYSSTSGTVRLVLSGIGTSAFFTGVTNLIIYGAHAGSDKAKTAQFWMVGSLSGSDWDTVGKIAILVLPAFILALCISSKLDLLMLGDETAQTLGLDVGRIRVLIIILTTVMVGTIVSASGVIGFIGLVIPHTVRMVVGAKHRRLLPITILTGGLFTMMADMISRVIVAPAELPIGILCALTGAPFFFWLLHKDAKGGVYIC